MISKYVYAGIGLILLLGLASTFGYRVGYKHGHDAAEAEWTGQAQANAAAAELQYQTQTMEDQKALAEIQERAAFTATLLKDSLANNAALSKRLVAAEQNLSQLKKANPDAAKILDAPYPDAVRQLRDPLEAASTAGGYD